MKITLQDIIDQVAEQTGTTKKLSEDFLHEFFNIIEEALNKNGIVKIKGLGTFKLLLVEERKSVNVQTGEEIIIPPHDKISFVPEKELKAAVNKPYSHLETYTLSKDGPVDPPENEDEEDEIPVIIDEKKSQPEIVIPIPIQEKEKNTTNIESDSTTKDETKTKNADMKEKEKKKSNKWIIIIILIILGLIALLLWCLNSSSPPVKEEAKTEETQVAPTPENEISEDEVMNENQFSNKKIIDETAENASVREDQKNTDSTTPNPNRNPEFPKEYMFDKKFDFRLVDFMQANFPNMKLITYGTPREAELKEGKRLTLMSLEYYGDKHFWVYIYLYNTDIIQNPNNIPAGTIIKVPRLDKSLVDPNNQASIDAAWDVQRYLLKM